MLQLTPEHLRTVTPKCKEPAEWANALNMAMEKFKISTDRGNVIEFLSQCAHESQEFNRLEENLNYSALRLIQVWPKRFPTIEQASIYAWSPVRLANHVYANRMGNGDETSGDGWFYRGRGLIMVTGLKNYVRIAIWTQAEKLLALPNWLLTKTGAAESAAAWWAHTPKLRELAIDKPDDDDNADFLSITRIVNGGVVGSIERKKYHDAFASIL